MADRFLISNCRLYDAPAGSPDISVLVEGAKIVCIGEVAPGTASDVTLDAGGRVVAPGFIDVHIQGAGGADVLDATPEALSEISKTCARFGVTGFLATTVFKPGKDNRHIEVAAEHVGANLGGARLLGIHLEGPFISEKKRGMIQPDCICEPSDEMFNEIERVAKGKLSMMTIAPELPGSLSLVRRYVESGIIASLGHTSATYEQALEGIAAGIKHVTHTFNAMPSIYHRAPGPLIAVLNSDDVTVQLITDGVHVHPAVVKLVYELLGPERIFPITDGMQAMGLPDGWYMYNGLEYESKEGATRYKDGTLIGTALGLSQMLGRYMDFTGCPFDKAIESVTASPARLLRIDDKRGSITVGKDADLVVLDEDCSVYTTIVAGKIAFKK